MYRITAVIGGGPSDPVTSDDLSFLLGLENSLRDARARFEENAVLILERMLAAGSEPGSHRATVLRHTASGVRHEILVVDGHERYRRLTGSAGRLAQADTA